MMEEKKYDRPYDPNYKDRFKNKPFNKFVKKEKEPEVAELYRTVGIFANDDISEKGKSRAEEAAKLLEENKFTLRTDTVNSLSNIFESIITRKEIYLPWKGFKDLQSKYYFSSDVSKEVAGMFHGSFENMKDTVKAFLSRNTRIILGNTMKSNVSILIVWSADGIENKNNKTPKTGYILHPINIASKLNIPIFNLENDDAMQRLKSFLNT